MPRGVYNRKGKPERVVPALPNAEQFAAAVGIELESTCGDCFWFLKGADVASPGNCRAHPLWVPKRAETVSCGEWREK